MLERGGQRSPRSLPAAAAAGEEEAGGRRSGAVATHAAQPSSPARLA